MSSYTVETFLYDLAYRPGNMQRFRAEPDQLYEEYFLSPQERSRIANWEVGALHAEGVSPMLLLLTYTAVHGIEMRNEYLARMAQVQAPAQPQAPLA